MIAKRPGAYVAMMMIISLLALATACSDDNFDPYGREGSLEFDNGTTYSVLHLNVPEDWTAEDFSSLHFLLECPARRQSFAFEGHGSTESATRAHGGGTFTCRMDIGDTMIPDGEYYLTVSGTDFPHIGLRRIRFSANVGSEVQSSPMSYDDLEGSGTETDPYLINDDGDFLTLLWYLEEDPDHAYGRWFRQTDSFTVPRRSQMIDGHVWAPVVFSGHYDGGGNTLQDLTYQGASDKSSDNGVGLFRELYSASVSNLSFSNALLLNVCDSVGIVAGSASGNCTLENISVSGTVTGSGQNIGGLVGISDGSLTLRGISVGSLAVSCTETGSSFTGLLVGRHSGGDLTVEKVSTPGHIFSVTGGDHVGGIVGCSETSGDVSFRDITLEHSVDHESSSVKVVYGGGKYSGGLAGSLLLKGQAEVRNVTIKAPVRGAQDVGALVGHADVSDMTVEKTLLASVVKGSVSVGGFFGYLGLQPGRLTFTGPDNSTRYVVKSSADAEVDGEQYVGALAGYYDSTDGVFDFKGKVEIAVNVHGKSDVGGVFGYAHRLTAFNPYDINFSSTSMRVEASDTNAGGIAGRCTSSDIDGGLRLDFSRGMPSQSAIASCYSGVVRAGNNAGGVAGSFSGSLKGVASSATVSAHSGDAAGVAAYLENSASHCASLGRVDAGSKAGGICAVAKPGVSISSCASYSDVSGGNYAAGICAYIYASCNDSVSIFWCANSGDASAATAGGIAAAIVSTYDHPDKYFKITECGNYGDIHGTGSSYGIGGIVGSIIHPHALVQKCANHGKVSASGGQYAVSGVAGELGNRDDPNWVKVSECMNSGEVSCQDKSTYIGGVVGRLHSGNLAYDSKIYDCYNTGALPTDQKSDTGGILGYAGSYTNTYRTFNSGKVSHGNAIIGTHHSGSLFHHDNNYYVEGTGGGWPSSTSVKKSDVGNKDRYHGFDFTNVWLITDDGPTLRNCPFQ